MTNIARVSHKIASLYTQRKILFFFFAKFCYSIRDNISKLDVTLGLNEIHVAMLKDHFFVTKTDLLIFVKII